jgi:hypothetical protein
MTETKISAPTASVEQIDDQLVQFVNMMINLTPSWRPIYEANKDAIYALCTAHALLRQQMNYRPPACVGDPVKWFDLREAHDKKGLELDARIKAEKRTLLWEIVPDYDAEKLSGYQQYPLMHHCNR